jgi:hypothetical protein
MARNWGKYGEAIEWRVNGIPQGAFVWINHNFNCSPGSSGNHISQADGDCAAGDLVEMVKDSSGVYQPVVKKGATINLYGANQQNTWKTSTYPVKEICAVRWPKKPTDPKQMKAWIPPRKITKSINCTSGKIGKESTR